MDPRARVIVGGLALFNPPHTMDEIEFLERMYLHRPELRGTLAGIALHPYQESLPDRFLPYTWVTSERDPANAEDWFGIWNRDGSPKQSGAAYVSAVRLMRRAAPSSLPAPRFDICHPGLVPAASTIRSSNSMPASIERRSGHD